MTVAQFGQSGLRGVRKGVEARRPRILDPDASSLVREGREPTGAAFARAIEKWPPPRSLPLLL